MLFYRLVADLIVLFHLAYVTFVAGGLLLILVGIWRQWQWIRNFWFRIAHLLAIGIVVAESIAGVVCPLTAWEARFRVLAGDVGEPGSFVGRLVHAVMFFDCPERVFTVAYCLFGLAVLGALILAPPRWPREGGMIRIPNRRNTMPLMRQQALYQLHAWTTNPSLLGHAQSVEIVMRAAALKYGGDPEIWAITGLLHDADYERWPEDHPQRIVDWLREQEEEEIAYAVSFHQTAWGLPPKTVMDKCLLACDELTGFVVACCLVRPDGIVSLEAKSVKKKLKDKAFAAKVDREIIRSSVELLGVDFDQHIQFVIDALKPHADELGLGGRQA